VLVAGSVLSRPAREVQEQFAFELHRDAWARQYAMIDQDVVATDAAEYSRHAAQNRVERADGPAGRPARHQHEDLPFRGHGDAWVNQYPMEQQNFGPRHAAVLSRNAAALRGPAELANRPVGTHARTHARRDSSAAETCVCRRCKSGFSKSRAEALYGPQQAIRGRQSDHLCD
jgi:hypothetical protein